jgi:hypothetical protein
VAACTVKFVRQCCGSTDDADPDAAPDSDADAYPTFHPDADPDPDPSFQIKAQTLECECGSRLPK